MVELRDWTNEDNRFLTQAWDSGYVPKKWSNVSFSVSYDWELAVSTVTFCGYDDGEFHIRTQLSTSKRFARSTESLEILGHRISRRDEPSN